MLTAKLLQPLDSPARALRHLDDATQDRLAALGAAVAPVQVLKRTGRRPLMFNGVTLATVCGVTPALPFWYELNVHRTVIDAHVTDIRLFHKDPARSDLFWVAEHDALDDAIAHLERFDPAGDVMPPRELPPGAAPAERALWVSRLQMEVDQITQHYRALVGELLHTLTPRP